MSKFMCVCGRSFHHQKDSFAHLKMHDDLSGCETSRHRIFKQHWRGRVMRWFFNCDWVFILRLVGVYLIYFSIVSHFGFSVWESIFLASGLGLYFKGERNNE